MAGKESQYHTRHSDSLKHREKKLVNKGVQRLERHPSDGLSLTHLPKSGHGGKFTWEGPTDPADNELDAAPPAIDERDPNYVDENEEKDSEVVSLVVGEVEVDKVVQKRDGVARVDVHPSPQP